MIVSSSNESALDDELILTPAMVRGLFLIWESELKRGEQFAEIREFDGPTTFTESFAGRTFGIPEEPDGYAARRDWAEWGTPLSDSESR